MIKYGINSTFHNCVKKVEKVEKIEFLNFNYCFFIILLKQNGKKSWRK